MKIIGAVAVAMSVMAAAPPASAFCTAPVATYDVPAEKGFDPAQNSRFLRWRFPAQFIAPIRTSAGSLTIYLDRKTFVATYGVTNESRTDRFVAFHSFFVTSRGPGHQRLGNDTFVLSTNRFMRDIDYNAGCAGAEDQLRTRIFHRTIFNTGTSGFNLASGATGEFSESGSMALLTQRRGTTPEIWPPVLDRIYENPPPLQVVLVRFTTSYTGPVGRDP